ncbi:Transcription factor IIIB 60 kDa subunit, partial [Lachnellula suecica]
MGRTTKPVAPRRDNPLRQRRETINAPTIFTQKAKAASATTAKKHQSKRQGCGDPECDNSVIVDGTCQGCGKIVDDSNIVSEVQFGETGNGAAMVQGSFIGADQGGARSSGPGFPRAGGSEEGRESTVREGKRSMMAMAIQLHISEQTVNTAVQILKLAAMNNFVQGRRMDVVLAVCLYSACRQTKPCKIMLIDFADRLQVNVFKLGRTFKALHESVSFAKDGIFPVLPEDLIWRFAAKLEFGPDVNKVAEDAVRMVQRMSLDWMVMGRRPSGVCGACLILAARMNNYRRSITEVVYIVKVTTHTIQKRLDEFKMTPSSALTVDEFLNNEFLESAHDPPSFYEKTEEFQKNKKRRKRKRNGHDGIEGAGEDDDEPESLDGDGDDQGNKRQRTDSTPNPDQAIPTVELRRDADGFAIPPLPAQSASLRSQRPDIPIDPDLVDDIIEDQAGTSFQKLVDQFGQEEGAHVNTESGTGSGTSSSSGRKGPDNRPIHVPKDWARAEDQLEEQMTEMVSDPTTLDHAIAYAEAEKRVARHMAVAMITQKALPFDENATIIADDEFADDPEVQNFLLSPDEVAKKEKMWINENKAWLRKQQIKEYKKKQDAKGPPKATRIRKKKPRIGEGQTSVASSPAEAVSQVLKTRNFSSKFNYDAFTKMFDDQNNGLGSAATSRAGSRAPSEMGDMTPVSTATPAANEDSETGDPDDYDDPNDYIDPDAEEAEGSVQGSVEDADADDWRRQLVGGEDVVYDDEVGAFDAPDDYD